MKIKFACAAAAVAMAFAAQTAYADDAPTPEVTVTGSAAIVSQYRFRGISQSDNKPAAQMSITVSHKSGFYVSTWGSSASAGQSAVNIGGSEIDVYGGYTHAIGKTGITFDGGLYGYLYPGMPSAEYFEIYGSLSKSYGPISAKVGPNQDIPCCEWIGPRGAGHRTQNEESGPSVALHHGHPFGSCRRGRYRGAGVAGTRLD